MKLEKSKEVKKTVTAVKQSKQAAVKCQGLKRATGIRAGQLLKDSDSSNVN